MKEKETVHLLLIDDNLGFIDELLDQSIKEAIAYFNSWGNVHNERWIEENRESLEKQYFGQYIAVINKTVIDAADTKEALEKRIEERQIRRFLTTIRQIGEFRPISELVKLAESNTLDKKASLEWEFVQNRRSPDTKFKALKDIVAFLNTEGGYLLIGVDDKTGNILGLENDLSLLQKNSLDEFEQKLNHLIRDYIGFSFFSYIKIYFEKVDNKDVCAVRVQKSDQPAFLKRKEKKDKDKDEVKFLFFMRANNGSHPLNPEEMCKYLKDRKLI